MENLELKVQGMKCVGCENRIKKALTTLKEVKEVTASFKDNAVKITLKKALTPELKQKIITLITNLDFIVEE